jgi:hypothetical protein
VVALFTPEQIRKILALPDIRFCLVAFVGRRAASNYCKFLQETHTKGRLNRYFPLTIDFVGQGEPQTECRNDSSRNGMQFNTGAASLS